MRLLLIVGLALGLCSCTGFDVAARLTCANTDKIQSLLDSIGNDRTSARARKILDIVNLACPALLPTPISTPGV